MRVETIKIATDNADGYKVINKDDFDPKIDKEFKPATKAKRTPKQAKDK